MNLTVYSVTEYAGVESKNFQGSFGIWPLCQSFDSPAKMCVVEVPFKVYCTVKCLFQIHSFNKGKIPDFTC